MRARLYAEGAATGFQDMFRQRIAKPAGGSCDQPRQIAHLKGSMGSGVMVAATPSECDREVRRSTEVAPFAVGLGLSGVGALDDPDRIAAEQ
jgi:hypothetical protein